MHVRQLVTILGICFSHAQAHVIFEPSESIKPIVRLVTTPHEVLGTSVVTGLDPEQKLALRESPYLYAHQLEAGVKETLDSLVYFSYDHNGLTTSIVDSILSYGHTILEEPTEKSRQTQLELFRNALYSRLHDLATKFGPKDWPERAKVVQHNLEAELKKVVLEFQKKHVAPAGDKEIIEHLQETAKKIKQNPKYHQVVERLVKIEEHKKTHLPYTANFGDMNYLTMEEVESAWKKINPLGSKDASPVKSLPPNEPADQEVSPTASHTTSARPHQLPPSPPMVASAA